MNVSGSGKRAPSHHRQVNNHLMTIAGHNGCKKGASYPSKFSSHLGYLDSFCKLLVKTFKIARK